MKVAAVFVAYFLLCRGSLAAFGSFAAIIIRGGIMNAAPTVIFILIAAEPMLEKLDRIKVKYGLVE